MTVSKTLKILVPVCWLSAMAVCFINGFPNADQVQHLPKSPNLIMGETIPISIRGTGTVYLNEQEWHRLAPYWYFYNSSIWVAIVVAFGTFILRQARRFRTRSQ